MARRRSQSIKRTLILGIVAVLFGIGLITALAYAAGNDKIDVSNLGDRDFWVGNADRLAKEIDDGGPFLVPDASPNKARDLYIQHLGPTDTKGWIAVLAGTRACPLQWTGDGFTDCHGATFPADGAGLTRYRTYVEGNAVYVDLRTELK